MAKTPRRVKSKSFCSFGFNWNLMKTWRRMTTLGHIWQLMSKFVFVFIMSYKLWKTKIIHPLVWHFKTLTDELPWDGFWHSDQTDSDQLLHQLSRWLPLDGILGCHGYAWSFRCTAKLSEMTLRTAYSEINTCAIVVLFNRHADVSHLSQVDG